MNAAHIAHLMAIAQLAIDLHNVKSEAQSAKHAYHDKLRDSGEDFDGLDPRADGWTEVIEFTKGEYKAHLAAKRRVYNAQRRLDNACRKVSA